MSFDAFDKMMIEQDHEEALRINELYDEKYQGVGSVALSEALAAAETEFTEKTYADQPFVKEFGYSTVKNAKRWWMYGAAYAEALGTAVTGDLQLDGAAYLAEEDRLVDYAMQKNTAGEQLIKGNAFYYRTFALLEQERLHRVIARQPDFDPFELGRQYAGLVLFNTLAATFDTMMRAMPQTGGAPLSFVRGSDVYGLEKPPRRPPNGPAYMVIKQGKDAAELPGLYIVDSGRSTEDPLMVMDVHGGRLFNACESLDLAATLADGDAAIERAAFTRTAAELEARREVNRA